jgi:hypothetical protein
MNSSVIPGRGEAASPESITPGRAVTLPPMLYGFRAPSLCSGPGMTDHKVSKWAVE